MRLALTALLMFAMMAGSAVAQNISFAEAARMCAAYVAGDAAELDWKPSQEWRRPLDLSPQSGPRAWIRDVATASNPRGARHVYARSDAGATPEIQRKSCSVSWWFDAEPDAFQEVNGVLQALRFSEGRHSFYLGSWARFDQNAFFEAYLSAHEQEGAWASTLLLTSTRLSHARIVRDDSHEVSQ